MKTEGVWAIIPARSGSKGFVNKNIADFLGIPLLAHSINFAKKLNFVDKVFVTTDSVEYANIAMRFGAEVPFLRSPNASKDTSMEEDILFDILNSCLLSNINPPEAVVWLRPTHPIRSIVSFKNAYDLFLKNKKSTCIVIEDDARIFLDINDSLVPVVSSFNEKSMVRRQDSPKAYRIFGGEIFNFPSTYDIKFLGENWNFVVAPRQCTLDIDDQIDLDIFKDYVNGRLPEYEGLLHVR
jgi:CMP-N,N'-diacetyllegionaminic acid synthase